MNNQLAKKLRKEAYRRSVGFPLVAYNDDRHPPIYRDINPDPLTPPVFVKVQPGVPTRLKPRTSRAVYRQMKRTWLAIGRAA